MERHLFYNKYIFVYKCFNPRGIQGEDWFWAGDFVLGSCLVWVQGNKGNVPQTLLNIFYKKKKRSMLLRKV